MPDSFADQREIVWVLTPITIPNFDNNLFQSINVWLLRFQLKVSMLLIGWHHLKPIIISMTPAAGLILFTLKRKAAIYYLCDKFDTYRDILGNDHITQLDREVANQSDLLICVSKSIQAAYSDSHPHAEYVPHGSNFELFNKAATQDFQRPTELQKISGHVIGYFGSLTESNDKTILEHLARERPDWSIVLIGQVISDYSMFDKYPNVFFLGKKPIEDLPTYGKYFDVCIMNWVMNDWIRYCNPVKAKEYLAMGKPVVSVPIPEVVETLSDVVSIAATPAEFLKQIEYELSQDSPERQRKRIEKVRGDTWKANANAISTLIKSRVTKRN